MRLTGELYLRSTATSRRRLEMVVQHHAGPAARKEASRVRLVGNADGGVAREEGGEESAAQNDWAKVAAPGEVLVDIDLLASALLPTPDGDTKEEEEVEDDEDGDVRQHATRKRR
jgi:hypothetical protein